MKTESRRKALYIAEIAINKKAQDVVTLDMRKLSAFCDFFVICGGTSQKMIAALADHIKTALKKKGQALVYPEGKHKSSWILMDYGDVVVHIFSDEARDFYNIEWMWSDAKKLKLDYGYKQAIN